VFGNFYTVVSNMKSGFRKQNWDGCNSFYFLLNFCIFLIPLVFIGLMIETGTTFLDESANPRADSSHGWGDMFFVSSFSHWWNIYPPSCAKLEVDASGLIYGGIGLFAVYHV